jgi:hypothetical protein
VVRLSATKLFCIFPAVCVDVEPLPKVMARSQLRKKLLVTIVPLAPL